MIVRILGEGQLEIPAEAMDELNALDESLTAAIDSNDEEAFRSGLSQLLAGVREKGSALADDYLGPSDLVLPGEDATVEEVKELLTDEGLIPD
jgi:PspAA-like protein